MDFLLRPTDNTGADSIITILPSPGFVIKSKLVSTQNRQSNLTHLEPNVKIFINVCHEASVPKPDIDFDPNVVYPLIMENQWEIPIVTSAIRDDKDKKGSPCYVWDCCINTICMNWISVNIQLRDILVEWCLESCEISDTVEISRDALSFPKMKKKGEIIPPLEILSDVLKKDYRMDLISFAEDEKNDPASILKLKRDLFTEETNNSLDDSDGKSLPSLFPNTSNYTSEKPLIQEIDDLTLNEIKNKKSIISQETPEIHFEVNIRKTNNRKDYKLRIEVLSEIESASSLLVRYQQEDNSLFIKNTNLDFYKEKKLEIPLPSIFSKADAASMRCFFIIGEKKLIIFI
ncbi:hypothetical protein HG535_0A04220 [Zygotorulaspora mrakii]|uniref:PIH1 N-terminal domain-containing protein n=1 Tax=Zygotorulaspora mrakii TaxID=42260 RepID=A0A7H9AY28_ZYGMR|nr:uncharacterized protein HG535_0A04220 [Zygotorulaspora mrakii]QLG70482.1 hypothetical protein HG535_0A04220 [Zygotorulaspora mrakii]